MLSFFLLSVLFTVLFRLEIIEYLKVASKVKFIPFKNLMQEILLSLNFAPDYRNIIFPVYGLLLYLLHQKKSSKFHFKKKYISATLRNNIWFTFFNKS